MKLENLLVDSQNLREETVSDEQSHAILEPYVKIDTSPEGRRLITSDSFEELSIREKLLVLFLGQEAMYRIGVAENLFMDIIDIMDHHFETGVYPVIRDLEKDGVLERSGSCLYCISRNSLGEIVRSLKD